MAMKMSLFSLREIYIFYPWERVKFEDYNIKSVWGVWRGGGGVGGWGGVYLGDNLLPPGHHPSTWLPLPALHQ